MFGHIHSTKEKLYGLFNLHVQLDVTTYEKISQKFERQRKECLDRITSEKGVQLRVNRSIQAEGAFALWKENQKFRQFLCRGQANVYAESVLIAIAQNIENLHRHIQKGQLGQHLYEV